uniref:Uncharacterized protein n=1 Tax=Arion vulgaris TaxID=1028688 RepID=A0A0B7ABJ8_9EUPU
MVRNAGDKKSKPSCKKSIRDTMTMSEFIASGQINTLSAHVSQNCLVNRMSKI